MLIGKKINIYTNIQKTQYSLEEIRLPLESVRVENIIIKGRKINVICKEKINLPINSIERLIMGFPSQLSIFKASKIFLMKVIFIPRIIQNKVLLILPNCVHQIQFGSHRFFQSHIS